MLWALLIVVPVIFIWLSKVITRGQFTALSLVDDGHAVTPTFWLPDVHAGTMTPIAIASLAALAGLFIVLDARTGDQRLALAGFRVPALLAARLGVIAAAVLLTTAASLVVTAMVFDARQWGVFIAFLVPFLDLGIGQSPMLRAEPPAWAQALPSYGAYRVLLDGGLTDHFDQTGPLLLGLAWLAVLGVLATVLFRRTSSRRRSA